MRMWVGSSNGRTLDSKSKCWGGLNPSRPATHDRKKTMKKLYHAEVTGDFVFVVDLDKIKEEKAMNEAYQYLSNADGMELYLDNVSEIEDINEIPSEFQYSKPLGANGKEDDECEAYFEGRDEANRIAAGLKELDYDLEDSFVEDLRKLLIPELGL